MPPPNPPEAYLKLATRIDELLRAHGSKTPEGEWNGPDSDQLDCAAILLRAGKKSQPWSEWGSGCYRPYTDNAAREEHDRILRDLKSLPELPN